MTAKRVETRHLILCYATVLRDPENPRDRDVGSNDVRVVAHVWQCDRSQRDIEMPSLVVVAAARGSDDDDG